jgi:hypothetical protein
MKILNGKYFFSCVAVIAICLTTFGCSTPAAPQPEQIASDEGAASKTKVEVKPGTFQVPQVSAQEGKQVSSPRSFMGMRGSDYRVKSQVVAFIKSGGTDIKAMCKVQAACAPELGDFDACFAYAQKNPMRPTESRDLLALFEGANGCEDIRKAFSLERNPAPRSKGPTSLSNFQDRSNKKRKGSGSLAVDENSLVGVVQALRDEMCACSNQDCADEILKKLKGFDNRNKGEKVSRQDSDKMQKLYIEVSDCLAKIIVKDREAAGGVTPTPKKAAESVAVLQADRSHCDKAYDNFAGVMAELDANKVMSDEDKSKFLKECEKLTKSQQQCLSQAKTSEAFAACVK